MRGTIYEISKAPENLGLMDESDFYEMNGVEFDYVKNEEKTEGASAAETFLKWLRSFGTPISGNSFILTETVKEKIFSENYSKFKKLADSMTLREFSTSNLYTLRSHIEDPYGDAVHTEEDSFLPLERWIREAETGVRYYVGNCVIMH